jgi:hypothetical protein
MNGRKFTQSGLTRKVNAPLDQTERITTPTIVLTPSPDGGRDGLPGGGGRVDLDVRPSHLPI